MNAYVEAYNLFYQYFEDVHGPLKIPEEQDKSPIKELENRFREDYPVIVLIQEVNLFAHTVHWRKRRRELCTG